jgi:hypothetical protein
MIRKITIPIKVTWTITCRCGRRFVVRKGQTYQCTCGNIYRC